VQRQSFDDAWCFQLCDPAAQFWEDVAISAERPVELPHDWSIELDRDPANPSGSLGGFFATGLAKYRKTFTLADGWRAKRVYVEFEGVYMNADVWLNERFVCRHPYGYTSFCCDLTPYLDAGENVLCVQVDNACHRNARWYSGSGIYRHAWLLVADPVHVGHWGVYVTTPEVTPRAATVRVRTSVVNASEAACDVLVRSRVVAPDGSPVGASEAGAAIDAGEQSETVQDVQVSGPLLWSLDEPHLYRLETEVVAGGAVVDTATTRFGIRSLRFDAASGFSLNGRAMKLRGGCVHHDNGVMGAASYDRSEERKVELLRANGFNAIRCAHNPPAPSFLDACDRLGMLVIDEAFDCWRMSKAPYDYHISFDDWCRRDVESMVRRDRNHPSVIMWSIGNEMNERGLPEGAEIARMLAGYVRALDPTRPVTAAINGLERESGEWGLEPRMDALFAALDVCGYNYREPDYRPEHERVPERVVFASESKVARFPEYWASVLELDYVIGDFCWTALDYLGESGIGRVHFEGEGTPFCGRYPWHQANCGDLDLCGFKRPQSHYRDAIWGSGDALYVAVHYPIPEGKTPTITSWGWPDVGPNWTWPGEEGRPFKVDVYSACEQVELFLNGESLGVRPAGRDERYIATFEVAYEAGVLRAVGSTGGAKVAERQLRTAGAPAAIRLTPDRDTIGAGPGDLAFVAVEIVDEEGLMHPGADHAVFFTTQGEGAIAAVGNGNPVSTEPYRGNRRSAFRGRCLVVVKSLGEAGEIRLRAQADGLEGAEVVIRVG
jgi:beta-galactosidase